MRALSLELLLVPVALSLYTSEPPVKLLTVQSVAHRFPAVNYTSLEEGYVEDAERTQGEVLNKFPATRLILKPGGCAHYTIPITYQQVYSYVQPARKQGEYFEDYCNKAPVSLTLSVPSGGSQSFSCFTPDEGTDPCSPDVCMHNLAEINMVEEDESISVKLCSDQDTSNLAAIWEINFSSSNESNKISGFMGEDARIRFRELAEMEEFNTQLSIVSIVGGRGVGKSTVGSLLSGNSSMFTVGSGSIGTTTTGADISPFMPTTNYSDTLGAKLGTTFTPPNKNYPLFLLDSEGMGIRGSAFDFITTSPPAVIAKVVIWIGVQDLETSRVLGEIKKYLAGLNNIIMQDKKSNDTYCEGPPPYGHFIVAINKMMGDASDDQLLKELMTTEPDYMDGAKERNQIRQQMRECFKGVSVHGLPALTVPPGEKIDYPLLEKYPRFKEGLAKIAISILERVEEPRTVTVAGMHMVLNASNAEVVIGTVIEEANKGQMDLTGFDAFWTYITQDIIHKLGLAVKEFAPIEGSCKEVAPGFQCSACVCEYRNGLVEEILAGIDGEIQLAKDQAQAMFGVDITKEVANLREEVIAPWEKAQTCSGSTPMDTEGHCDISQLTEAINQPGKEVQIPCKMLFLCGESVLNAKLVTITTDAIHVAPGTLIKTAPSADGADGASGGAGGVDGQNGGHGANAGSLTITAQKQMRSSAGSIGFTSKGGSGGKGGNGGNGADKTGGIPAGPKSAQEVVAQGSHTTDSSTGWRQCCCHGHKCCGGSTTQYHYQKVISFDACGGNGGKGGDGGNGGAAGLLTVQGEAGITATNNRQESSGGNPGTPGAGAYGVKASRDFGGYRQTAPYAECHGCAHSCHTHYSESYGGYTSANHDAACPGAMGQPGKPGADWKP